MAFAIDDRLLWLGLGAFTFLAINHVANGLREVETLTRVSHPLPPPRSSLVPRGGGTSSTPSTSQEDAIKTSSLLTLATCHNMEIRKAATQILCTRFFASTSARKLLLRDLESTDDEARRRAQLAFGLLYEHGMVQEYNVPPPTPRAHRARERDRERGDAAERDLRRRRREAMIINEGDRPISQEDVYMRDQEGQMRARGPDV